MLSKILRARPQKAWPTHLYVFPCAKACGVGSASIRLQNIAIVKLAKTILFIALIFSASSFLFLIALTPQKTYL